MKSPPELWEELSAIEGLTKHFGAFGEIRITKLEPEHTVAWEGEHASGTVSIEPSGWGTKVTLQAELQEVAGAGSVEAEPETDEPEAAAPTAVESVEAAASTAVESVEPEPAEAEPDAAEANAEPVVEDATAKRRGFWSWLFRTRSAAQLSLAVESRDDSGPVPAEGRRGTAEAGREPVPGEPEPVATEPEPVAAEREPVAAEPEPVADEPEVVPDESDDAPIDPERARLVLDEALEALGAAHHRPFSRG